MSRRFFGDFRHAAARQAASLQWYGDCLSACMLRWLGIALLLADVTQAGAQPIELSPFGGVRFGGDPFEVVATPAAVLDRRPAIGFIIDFPLSDGAQLEGLFSYQDASVALPGGSFGAPVRSRVSVEHYQIGGLQEYGARVRPFFTGVLGLTRYATGIESAWRFTAGGGGGVKLFPSSRVGVRLDGRVFGTVLDAHGTALACGNGACFIRLHVNATWQAEFTAGLLVRIH